MFWFVFARRDATREDTPNPKQPYPLLGCSGFSVLVCLRASRRDARRHTQPKATVPRYRGVVGSVFWFVFARRDATREDTPNPNQPYLLQGCSWFSVLVCLRASRRDARRHQTQSNRTPYRGVVGSVLGVSSRVVPRRADKHNQNRLVWGMFVQRTYLPTTYVRSCVPAHLPTNSPTYPPSNIHSETLDKEWKCPYRPNNPPALWFTHIQAYPMYMHISQYVHAIWNLYLRKLLSHANVYTDLHTYRYRYLCACETMCVYICIHMWVHSTNININKMCCC